MASSHLVHILDPAQVSLLQRLVGALSLSGIITVPQLLTSLAQNELTVTAAIQADHGDALNVLDDYSWIDFSVGAAVGLTSRTDASWEDNDYEGSSGYWVCKKFQAQRNASAVIPGMELLGY